MSQEDQEGNCAISDGDSSDGWNEMEENDESVVCLFCESTFSSIDDAFRHLEYAHNFDIMLLQEIYAMDQYSYIKMINFIVAQRCRPEDFGGSKDCQWSDEKYLQPPVDEKMQNWLTFDFEHYVEEAARKKQKESSISETETITVKVLEFTKLQNALKLSVQKNQDLEDTNKQLQDIIEGLRKSAIAALEEEDEECEKVVKPFKDDESYFTSYSHYAIHQEMLCDKVRTLSYKNAIEMNSSSLKGKVVLDLGCGTGILSLFASQAGARKVISVDQSDIIYQAMDIAKRNNFENIKFHKGRIEEVNLPDKVDVILSEWMGYFLLFEGMLDSVIYARDNYLSPGGLLLPNRCNISLVGSGDLERHRERIGFWQKVYGFDMSSMKEDVLREASVEVCDPMQIITEPNTIADFNLMTVDTNCYSFSYDFKLRVRRGTHLTSLVGYFDTFFDLPDNPVKFSTGPHVTPTHWKQVVFFLPRPMEVISGDYISGKFQCQRNPHDTRSLLITIRINDQELQYDFM
uniref:type I protein arginine methyltransferase n=1 Tax=Nyssomyia neivai TaxID=330878 RepID=A0A1L8DMT1_9DIPT